MRVRNVMVAAVVMATLVGGVDAQAGPHAEESSDPVAVGFGTRAITPSGEPPAEWAPYFDETPTGIWGEPFGDANGNGCYDVGETHTDHVWNQTGDARFVGAHTVRGVTIVGDPQSAGKWDGLWAGAGFGSQCAEGVFDDTWARAMVLDDGDSAVAIVSLDVVGFFNLEVQRARRELAARYPDLAADLDELIISSTHTHEGVDTMGYWGQTLGIDGKSPAYQAFIRSQVLDAIKDAWEAREPARAKFAKTEHLVGVRDSRDPQVKDPYAYSAQFVAPDDADVLGTIVNWSNHPEALGGDNGFISSDFPHGTRTTLEDRYPGSTAVYFSGSVGGLMTPLRAPVVDPKTNVDYGTGEDLPRAYAIGRILAEAVADDLDVAPAQPLHGLEVESRDLYVGSDNTALAALNAAGVFDVPTFVGGESWGSDPALRRDGVPAGRTGTQFRTEIARVEVGPAMFLTVPGELFPELEVGFGSDDPVAECAAANTGFPLEPVISEHDDTEYQFVLGLAQDELGYIVPRYDHWFLHAEDQVTGGAGNGDGLVPVGALEAEDPCGEGHYEETVSASSTLAPWTTCVAAELAGNGAIWDDGACSYANTHTTPHGVGGSVVDQYGIGKHPGHADDHSHAHDHEH